MTTVERARGELADDALPVDISGDQARAERAAAARRHRRQLIDLAIRLVSLAIALALWELAARNVDPVLFTSPTKVAIAAYHMVLSGELWTYLWPSLVVPSSKGMRSFCAASSVAVSSCSMSSRMRSCS